MRQPKDDHRLRVEVETKGCNLPSETLDKMNVCLDALRRVTRNFPVADLYISVFRHARGNDFHVKTSLVLMHTTLFTGDHDDHIYPAFERCASKLVHKVQAYTGELGNTPEVRKQQKGTRQDVYPTVVPDAASLDRSVQSGDYAEFRDATFAYEGSIRDRVARRVERHPEAEVQLGQGLTIDDIVEEVFLNAFEHYPSRPEPVRFGEWLEGLIDPSIHALLTRPDEEKENIDFARTLRQTPRTP